MTANIQKEKQVMAKAIYETRDRQLIPLDDIQHINARANEAVREGYETLCIMYKDGMKVMIPASEYDRLKMEWEARKNGNHK